MPLPVAPTPRVPSRKLPLLMAVLVAVLVVGAGLVYAVHAEWQPVQVVKPYDPLPNW